MSTWNSNVMLHTEIESGIANFSSVLFHPFISYHHATLGVSLTVPGPTPVRGLPNQKKGHTDDYFDTLSHPYWEYRPEDVDRHVNKNKQRFRNKENHHIYIFSRRQQCTCTFNNECDHTWSVQRPEPMPMPRILADNNSSLSVRERTHLRKNQYVVFLIKRAQSMNGHSFNLIKLIAAIRNNYKMSKNLFCTENSTAHIDWKMFTKQIFRN